MGHTSLGWLKEISPQCETRGILVSKFILFFTVFPYPYEGCVAGLFLVSKKAFEKVNCGAEVCNFFYLPLLSQLEQPYHSL